MFKLRILMLLTLLTPLTGCISIDSAMINPEVKAATFKGRPYSVESCLYEAARHQHMTLEEDDPLPNGMKQFNLFDSRQRRIAMLDASKFSDHQTSVNIYYVHNDPAVAQRIDSLIRSCK